MNAATEQLWQEFSERLGRFIRARVGDAAVAEDIRQEVFLKLHRQIGGAAGVADLEAWLFRAARHAVIDHYRSRRPVVEVPETLPAEEAEGGEWEELRAAFRRMIYSLPDAYRDAVVLADLEQLKLKEVAQRLGLSLPGAKSRVQRGRMLLRGMLEECCSFEFDRQGRVRECEPKRGADCRECGGGSGLVGSGREVRSGERTRRGPAI